MKFKSGDLVVCVGGNMPEVVGKVFNLTDLAYFGIPLWHTNPEFRCKCCGDPIIFHEGTLRLIEDKPGEDETLQWKEVPQPDPVMAPRKHDWYPA